MILLHKTSSFETVVFSVMLSVLCLKIFAKIKIVLLFCSVVYIHTWNSRKNAMQDTKTQSYTKQKNYHLSTPLYSTIPPSITNNPTTRLHINQLPHLFHYPTKLLLRMAWQTIFEDVRESDDVLLMRHNKCTYSLSETTHYNKRVWVVLDLHAHVTYIMHIKLSYLHMHMCE